MSTILNNSSNNLPQLQETRCLVTGGAGFIGSHLVDQLLQSGNEVLVIDDLTTGSLNNIKKHLTNKRFQFIKMNILDPDIHTYLQNVDIIYHLAAIPRVQFSFKDPKLTSRINVEGTINVLEAARKADIRRIIYASSSSVYGDQSSLPLREEMNLHPISPYGLQKLIGELYVNMYNSLYSLDTIILRYFNVYGPRDRFDVTHARLIPKTIFYILNDKHPEIYGDGNQSRDFTYVEDVIRATIQASLIKSQKASRNVFNIGFGNNHRVIEVVLMIEDLLGKKNLKPIFKENLLGEPRDTIADITKAKTILKWEPKFPLREGLMKTVKWFLDRM